MRLLLLCLALLGTSSPVFAQPASAPTEDRTRFPNFLGATGLLYIPSAYTLGDREWAGHFHANSDFHGGGILTGITDRFELGLTFLDTQDDTNRSFFDEGDTQVLANGKFNLLTETRSRPAFAVGVIDAFQELKSDPSWYVVASKYFTRGDTDQRFALIGHLGYGDGIYNDDFFAGAELLFNRNMSAMAEYQDGKFNVGVRARYRGFAATVGLFDTKQFGGGISYTVQFR